MALRQASTAGAALGSAPGFTRHAPAAAPGNGSQNTGPTGNEHEDLTPWVPTQAVPWDKKHVRHLMRRAAFGARPQDVETLVKIGHKKAVDILLLVPGETIPTSGTFRLPHGELVNLSFYTDASAAWVYLMTNSPWQLQEKMALFFHDHFATGVNKVRYVELMTAQINLFRRHALGNFRDLLIDVSADPAMLYWLDNRLSRVGRPNENYGREVLELFSMGVGAGYTEKEVQEAARCLTGWYCLLDRYRFINNYHDYGIKALLGRWIYNASPNGELDGHDLVDAILSRGPTAKFMCKKIWEYFVYENPSQALVDKLAARWVADNYDFRALMELIFRSKAFYSARAMRTLVKNPVEYVVGMLRTLDQKTIDYGRVTTRLLQMGLPLLNYAGPDGLPDGSNWINSQNVINRSNFAMEVITRRNGYPYYSVENRRYLPAWDVFKEIGRKGLKTPTQIVDYFLDILVDADVPAKVRSDLIAYMTKTDFGSFTWNLNVHGNLKISGLVHLIQSLPEAQIN